MADHQAVPSTRFSRVALAGRLAGSVALNSLAIGARQLSRGQRPRLIDMMFTPRNMEALAERLGQMRGAAMKVGQLLSMESGEVLPAELAELLSRLRAHAVAAPWSTLEPVLTEDLGDDWRRRLPRFNEQPLAAASIGQVHEAYDNHGRRLALKIQYPGVRESINSDLDNVALLLRWVNLLPEGMRLEPLLEVARAQLHEEADYRLEARYLARFSERIGVDDRYELPDVEPSLCSDRILAMSFVDGIAIEALADSDQETRNRVGRALTELALREVFAWGLVQTDSNFANYRYNPQTQQVQLLDFGATRCYDDQRRGQLMQLLKAVLADDEAAIKVAAINVGYIGETDPHNYQRGIVGLLRRVGRPLRQPVFDFAGSTLARDMSEAVLQLRLTEQYTRLPPTDMLFLHRKLGGLYLLLKRLGVRLPLRPLAEAVIDGG